MFDDNVCIAVSVSYIFTVGIWKCNKNVIGNSGKLNSENLPQFTIYPQFQNHGRRQENSWIQGIVFDRNVRKLGIAVEVRNSAWFWELSFIQRIEAGWFWELTIAFDAFDATYGWLNHCSFSNLWMATYGWQLMDGLRIKKN